jgi:hypothetical protein
MPEYLLAPVPAVHITAAKTTCAEVGKVVFGTKKQDVAEKLATAYDPGDISVLIYVSMPESDPDGVFVPGPPKASLVGTFAGITPATTKGTYPHGEAYRPRTTTEIQQENPAKEEAWYFWEVSDLQALPQDQYVPVTQLRALGRKTNMPAEPPRAPTLVVGPELAVA